MKCGLLALFVSETYLDSIATEFDSLRRCIGTSDLNQKQTRTARPFLHSLIRFQGQLASRVLPAEANPNDFCVRAVAIPEALSVIFVKSENAVGSWMNSERGRFSSLLGCELADRIEWNDSASADVERKRCEIDRALDPSIACEFFASPPVEPQACG